MIFILFLKNYLLIELKFLKPAEQCFLKEMKLIAREQPQLYTQLHNKLLELCRLNLTNITVGANNTNENRLATSLVKTYDLMTQNDLNIENLPECLSIFLSNVKVTKDMTKLILYVDLFGDVLLTELNKDKINASKEVKDKVMFQMMLMLCHQYPRVRKYTATKLFEMFMNVVGDDESLVAGYFLSEDDYTECNSLLTDTDWNEPLDKGVREARNRICDLTRTPKPVMKRPTAATDQK